MRSIFESCRDYGLEEPLVENSGIDVRVTLLRPNYIGKAHSDSPYDLRIRIMDILQSNPGATLADISAKTDVPQRTVERIISDLKRKGAIDRTGSTRNGQWVVLKR